MLAVLTLALGELVEPFHSSLPVQTVAAPAPTLEAHMIELPDMLRALKGVIDRDMALIPRPVQRLSNPCAEDMRRLHCSEAACLKRNAETLDPVCAALLLNAPEPSPAAPVQQQHVPAGFFSFTSQSSDGEVHRTSGPLSMMLGTGARVAPSSVIAVRPMETRMPSMSMSMPPGLSAMLSSMLPPELATTLEMLNVEEEKQEEDDDSAAPQHPCGREVELCTRETKDRTRSAIEGCLLRHLPQLSSDCQCFVHHLVHSATPHAAAAARSPPSAKMVAPAAAVMVDVRTVPVPALEEVPPAEARRPMHSISCLLLFTALFLLSFLLARACIVLLCCGKSPRRVVVVPPEQAIIKTVGMPAVGPLLVTDVVQVAEPVRGGKA